MKTLVLKSDRDRSVIHRHPWIFAGAVNFVSGGDPESGETVAVRSAKGEPLGFGSYSPASAIRVRMLSFDPAREPDDAFVRARVAAAVRRRAQFFASGETDAFRLLHAESDGVPGAVADWYAGWIVTQFASAGAERWREAIVAELVASVPGVRGVFDRSDVDSREREGLPSVRPRALFGEEPPELVSIREGAIRCFVDVRRGHKTGFYLDQRDARAAVGARCAGKSVLNCFSYTGGFGLAAAAAGAASVVNLDLSADALALAGKNFGLLSERSPAARAAEISFVQADAFKQLRAYRDRGRTFDVIVLDPPKFADTKSQAARAARGYKDVNLLAMKMLAPGGTLATFSCSGAMTPSFFDQICWEAAVDAKREFAVLERLGQAADHPVSLFFPEGLYLKGLVLGCPEIGG